MSGAEDCFFNHQWKIPYCPYKDKLYTIPGLLDLMSFCNKAMDSWEVDADPMRIAPNPNGPQVTEKVAKKKQYGISVEKFEWACRLHRVQDEDALSALAWVGIAVKAANDAPELEIKRMRRERFNIVDDDDDDY